METVKKVIMNKKSEVVFFSSTAIALYGYDQGMMSLINTNYNYLETMGIGGEDPLVAVIVSVYYLGCAVGSIIASRVADKKGRKLGIFACLTTTIIGNLLMFISGIGQAKGAIYLMLIGRIIMGLGVGGIDSVIPVYSAELNDEGNRGRALAQEFQANIFGLNVAFALNVLVTRLFTKSSQWAWRIPIIAMQVYPVLLIAIMYRLPESPRWFIFKERDADAKSALNEIYEEDDVKSEFEKLVTAREEESSSPVHYIDMLLPGRKQFHPTVLVTMGQINQGLTGYGCVSVYGPQIFQLLGFDVETSEDITLGNYLFYFLMMTFAWMLIDSLGRRTLMIWGSGVLASSFGLLTIFGALAVSDNFHVPALPIGVSGSVVLFIATAAFGIGWLPQPWLIPTEIYPSSARAQGAAISVVVWGFVNFLVTFLSPILFNNLKYWIFLIFAASNTFAGWWTWAYSPETGIRTFEENASFFIDAKEQKTWLVRKVNDGEFKYLPDNKAEDGETAPLLHS